MKNQPKATRQSVAAPIPIPVLTVLYPDIWIYAKHDTKELEEYLISIQPTFATILPKTNIHDGIAFLCNQLHIPMHPQIHQKTQQKSIVQLQNLVGDQSIDSIRNNNELVQYLVFQNTLIDTITLKLLQYLWPNYLNLQVLKVYNTTINDSELEIITKIISENKLMKLFIEYVNKLPIINSDTLIQLFLRGNNINDTILQKVLTQNNFPQLQLLELSDNPLSKQGIVYLGDYMSKKNYIQYLGLARIGISLWEELKPLLSTIGLAKMTEQQLQNYREMEERRDKLIKEQLKQKKKEVINDIELEPIVQNTDGSYSMTKNGQLQQLCLALNPFKESDKDVIEKFLIQNGSLNLNLQGSYLENKTKEKLRKKFQNLVI